MSGDERDSERAAAMNRRLERLAVDGKWQRMADTVKNRDALLARIPAAEREPALLAARRSNERLQAMAQAAKSQCAEQLSALKRGRQAAASYRAHR